MATQTARLLKRLRNDFQLSIITLMGFFGIVSISPYAVYRLLHGNYLVGIADTIIVLSTLFAVLYAWVTRDTVKPGIYLAAVFSVGATLIAINLGVNGLFWIYPLILFNFFMVTPGKALLATALVLVSLVSHALLVPGSVFESDYQMVSFLVTCMMASVLSFIFAFRTRTQRDQLQLLATHDPLTGARNRRAMNEELKIAMASHRRHSDSYGLLVMDLDHFKQINDRFGHPAGDEVIREVARRASESLRKRDLVGRIGGEEFAVIFPQADLETAAMVCERLRLGIAHSPVVHGDAIIPFTASVGVADFQPGDDLDHLMARADAALYEAKTGGRNQVRRAA